jgi:hypothetical protein
MRNLLMDAINDTLRRYPNGLAERIVEIGGRQLYYMIGPRERDIVRVDVWERHEIEANYQRAGNTFFNGDAPSRATATGVYPAWVFDRHPEIERESNLVLAGDLIIDLSASPEHWTSDQRETVAAIQLRLLSAARTGAMPENAIVYGWAGGKKPANAVDTDNRMLMDAWASERTCILVRVAEHNATRDSFLRQPDSKTLQHLGILKRH